MQPVQDDWLPPLRAPFFRHFVAGGATLAALLEDDDALDAYVRGGAFGQWHPCGPAAWAIPRANLNLPTIMIAEKLAAAISREP